MNGPDHYRRSQELLDEAAGSPSLPYSAQSVLVARAQTHATLALAAATAEQPSRGPAAISAASSAWAAAVNGNTSRAAV